MMLVNTAQDTWLLNTVCLKKVQVKAAKESERKKKLMHEAKTAREEHLLAEEGVTYNTVQMSYYK